MKLAVCGICGRMGRLIASLALNERIDVTGGIESQENPACNSEIEIQGQKIYIASSLKKLREKPDVVVDFSLPSGSASIADECNELKIPLVTGTTGLEDKHQKKIIELSKNVPVVQSPNMSIGVNVLFKLCEDLPGILGPSYDIEILEIHHRNKADAPSGTALRIYEIISKSQEEAGFKPVFGREGKVGKRKDSEIGVLSVRGGDVAGDHTVFFLGNEERIEITHRASSRAVFARGALRACKWVIGKPPALYSMFDVLGIK